jgi:hypothetical protein
MEIASKEDYLNAKWEENPFNPDFSQITKKKGSKPAKMYM